METRIVPSVEIEVRSDLDLLTDLQRILAEATVAGLMDRVAENVDTYESVNDFCDAVSLMLAHERERNQKPQ